MTRYAEIPPDLVDEFTALEAVRGASYCCCSGFSGHGRSYSGRPTKTASAFRFALIAVFMLVLTAATARHAHASSGEYPSRPIHLIVPFPAGGGADHWGQLIARKLATELGQPIVIDNIPGVGGNIGTAAAAGAAADGYTLLFGSVGPLVVHQFSYSKLSFDPAKNFEPVALIESSPILLIASPAAELSSAADVINLARSKPDLLSYASNGNGSPEQVAGELFKKRLQLQIRHLPYDGAGPARKALLAGQASLMFDPCKGALPMMHQGARALAVAASARLSQLPDVPTFTEVGLPRFELRIWTGILAPAGTPRDIVVKLNRAVQKILELPEMKQEIAAQGGEPGATTPDDFTNFLNAERRRWSAFVSESAIPKAG